MEDSLPLFAFESLKFTNADRIIFASEKDGRNHLYSIDATDGAPQLLTPGDFDVEDVALSADERSVLYSSNQDDVERRRRKTIHGRHAAPNSNRLCTIFLLPGRPFGLDHGHRYY
jgi:dipeptidyl aminopeptidase/acylaminoacyl peptidase